MSDFPSFRNAVLENDDLQEQVISTINTAITNRSGLGDGITALAKTHGYTITSDEVYEHADFLGQDGDLTDFELEMISGGQVVRGPGKYTQSGDYSRSNTDYGRYGES